MIEKNRKAKIVKAASDCANNLFDNMTWAESAWDAGAGKKLAECLVNIRAYLEVDDYLKLLPACFRATQSDVPTPVQFFSERSNTESAHYFASAFSLFFEDLMDSCFDADTEADELSPDTAEKSDDDIELPCGLFAIVIPAEAER